MHRNDQMDDRRGEVSRLQRYMFNEIQLGDKCIETTRHLIAREGVKVTIGREWLPTMNFAIVKVPVVESEVVVIEKYEENLCVEPKKNLFKFSEVILVKEKKRDHIIGK